MHGYSVHEAFYLHLKSMTSRLVVKAFGAGQYGNTINITKKIIKIKKKNSSVLLLSSLIN